MTEYDDWYDQVECNGSLLWQVPLHLRDYEMCKTAVTGWPPALRVVPVELRDYQLCLIAVTGSISALQYVPEDLPGREFLERIASSR
jgi:hypothetical protein